MPAGWRNTAETPGRHDHGHGQAAGVRAPHPRGARHPLRAAVVHRRARLPQVGRGGTGRARGRVRRGHRLRRLGDRGLRPGRTSRTCSPSPTPATFQILPWRSESPGTARMFCDILMPDGTPSYADPRFVLKRTLAKAADLGFTFYTHPEIEFFLLRGPARTGQPPVPVDHGGYFDHIAARHRPRLPPRRDHDARVDGHLGGVQPPRGRARPAGDRPAVRRRADRPPTTS